jgi:hypothetical protein
VISIIKLSNLERPDFEMIKGCDNFVEGGNISNSDLNLYPG